MDKQSFLTNLEEMLELSAGTLRGGESLSQLAEWDSLAVVSFIAMVDSKYGKSVEANKLAQARTIDDLFVLANG
jgi:acyl carrier protein